MDLTSDAELKLFHTSASSPINACKDMVFGNLPCWDQVTNSTLEKGTGMFNWSNWEVKFETNDAAILIYSYDNLSISKEEMLGMMDDRLKWVGFSGNFLLKVVAIIDPVDEHLILKLLSTNDIPDKEDLNIDIHSEVF